MPRFAPGMIVPRPQPLVSSDEASRQWEKTAPATELLRYYHEWPRVPIIHALFFAKSITNLIREISELNEASYIPHLYFNTHVPEREYLVSSEFALADAYFDRSAQLFRAFSDDQPNTYAIDVGLRVIRSSDQVISRDMYHQWKSISASVLRFIPTLRHSGEAMLSIEPTSEPSIFGTYTALSSAHRCLNRNTPFRHSVTSKLELELQPIVAGMLSAEAQFQDAQHFAFRRKPTDHGCLSTTAYAYHILRFLRDLGVDVSRLDKHLHTQSAKLLTYIKECWDVETGGFKSAPVSHVLPNLTHTRYAIHLVRTLLERHEIDADDTGWLDMGKVLSFLTACWSDHSFATIPGGQPTMIALREALSVIKYAQMFKLMGLGTIGSDYQELPGLVDWATDVAESFVRDCIDYEDQACFMYPVAVLRMWAHAERLGPSTFNGTTAGYSASGDASTGDYGDFVGRVRREATMYLREGDDLYNAGDMDGATLAYKKAIRLQPSLLLGPYCADSKNQWNGSIKDLAPYLRHRESLPDDIARGASPTCN